MPSARKNSDVWTCEECERQFGKPNQSHECAPALIVDEYFETGPAFERPIFEVIRNHLRTLDKDVYFEPVSVGIFFKRRSTFAQLRTMTKWVAVCFNLPRAVESSRLSRKVVAHGGKFYHVVNVRSVDDVDDELRDWLAEAWEIDEPSG